MSIENIEPLIQSLNRDFVDLKSKIESIVKKYEDLEKKLEKQKKSSFKCRKCKKEFPNLKKLRKHRDAEHEMCSEEFKCKECEKEFKTVIYLSCIKESMKHLNVKSVIVCLVLKDYQKRMLVQFMEK